MLIRGCHIQWGRVKLLEHLLHPRKFPVVVVILLVAVAASRSHIRLFLSVTVGCTKVVFFFAPQGILGKYSYNYFQCRHSFSFWGSNGNDGTGSVRVLTRSVDVMATESTLVIFGIE